MPFPYDRYPWLNFQELNLAYFIKHFREIFQEWNTLYHDLTEWKDATDQELEEWKSAVETGISSWETGLQQAMEDWKDETEADISTWESATLSALDAWKTATTVIFEQIRTDAAGSALAAAGSATAAQTAMTAAQTAQAAAETAAAGVESALNQIAINSAAVKNLALDLFGTPHIPSNIGYDDGHYKLVMGSCSSTSGALLTSTTGKRYIANTDAATNNCWLAIDGLPIRIHLGFDWVEWSCWSYRTASSSTATHSNTGNRYIPGTNDIILPDDPVDTRFSLTFHKLDDTVFTAEELLTVADALAFYRFADASLTKAGAAADAKTIGDVLFAGRGELKNSIPLILYAYQSGDTWSDVPLDSTSFHSASTFLTLYSDTDHPFPVALASNSSVFVVVYGGRKYGGGGSPVDQRARIIYAACLQDPLQLVYGYVGETASSITWRVMDYAAKPGISIAYFGDSVTRGIVDNSTSPIIMASLPIPAGVARELSCRCENFGIGTIGYCEDANTNPQYPKGRAYEYLKRWVAGPSSGDWYGPNRNQFLGTGSAADFNTLVLAYGANDNHNYNLGSLEDLEAFDQIPNNSFSPDSMTGGTYDTILTQLYRCVRYVKSINPSMNIIIVAPFVAGSARPNGDYDDIYMDHTKRSMISAFEEFAVKYGCGFISSYDAPIDRFALSSVLNNTVHPTDVTYVALGKYMAGKISALAK